MLIPFLFGASRAGTQNAPIPSPSVPASAKADVRTIAHWIQERRCGSATLSSFGGIRVHSTPGATGANGTLYYRVSPYMGHLAVLGLLESRESFALQVAERWITWYLAPEGLNAIQMERASVSLGCSVPERRMKSQYYER